MTTNMHGFELLREQDIPELNTKAKLYRHVKTGAQLLSMENDDENKVFGINFFTPPPDSAGVPHIMEHSVLCGSRKYPVKEPFVELIKSSLNTFLNAMTYSDKTCYPVASQNLRDFYNLIDVYLDAVFYPRITPQILQQEGWHYELEALDAPLVYKGVVFNEMKGAYSSPDNLFAQYTQQSLFPDNVYGHDSGGDPKEIPNLTYEAFTRFHETYYHPSNAQVYFYGDDNPEERLHILDGYLRDFEPVQLDHQIKPQPRFKKPRRITFPYDAGPDGAGAKKGMVTVNWLLTETGDPQTMLSLEILTYILIGTPASPLRKALIDSRLGEDLAGVGLENEVNPMYFSTGLKGIAVEDAEKVEALIQDTLKSLARDGIEKDMVEAALNTVEFRLRENNTGQFPRGLFLMLKSLTTWLHGADPLATVAFEAPLKAIKDQAGAGERYFEGLIKQYMLDNKHRTTVVMAPEPGLHDREEAQERERLDKVREAASEDDLRKIVEDTQLLKQMQVTPDSPEALAKIPTLTLADLDKKNKHISLDVSEAQGARLLYHDLFTNGIIYLDLGLNLHTLPQEFLPYVGLFSQALLEMGTDKEDFVKLSQRIGRKTGGIRTSSFASMTHDGGDASTAWLFLRGKATPAQSADLLAILRDVLLTGKLDNQERFRQIVLEEKAGQEAGLVPGGHQVAYTRLKSAYNEADWADEQMDGVTNLLFLRALAEEVEKDWPSVLERLEAMRRTLLSRNTMLVNVTVDAANWAQFQPKLADFLASLPMGGATATWLPKFSFVDEGLTIPAQVNYVAKGANLYKLGYKHHGSSAVISNYLRTTWLWERVRVQGGAYGGFCIFDRHSGVFSYVSYRDPNLIKTLENYDGTAKFLQEADLSDEEVTRAIIGTIGDLDAYMLPDAKGWTSMMRYLLGDNEETLQRRRDEILSTTAKDFRAFGKVLEDVNLVGRVVVLGSQGDITEANGSRGGNWLQLTKVM
jgi:presequence protease